MSCPYSLDHADATHKTADYITMVYGSIPAMGEAWDKWEKSEKAAKVMEGKDIQSLKDDFDKINYCWFTLFNFCMFNA